MCFYNFFMAQDYLRQCYSWFGIAVLAELVTYVM